jgi:hypothetical protein
VRSPKPSDRKTGKLDLARGCTIIIIIIITIITIIIE